MKKLLISIGVLIVASLLVMTSCSSSPDYHFSIADSDYDDDVIWHDLSVSESSGGSGR